MVAAMRKTGGTAGAFARRHGLQEERVRRWVRRVEGRWQAIAAPAAGPTVTFAPVGVIEAARSGSPLEVVVGECVVRVGHGFDAELLRQVVSALRGEGC